MTTIPEPVLHDLISLGGLGDGPCTSRDQLVTRLKQFDWVNRLHWDTWHQEADLLSEVELRNLVRGLTIAESETGWCGGSVAAVIWVYRRYEARFPEHAREVADWVLVNSDNPYVPFGRMRGGAKSVREYEAYLSAKARRSQDSERAQEDARQHKRIRAAVRLRLAKERRVLQAAQARARAEMIALLEELPPKARAEHIAWDDLHSLAFYPASFAALDEPTFRLLDQGTQNRLMEKTSLRRKGVWSKLHQRLATL